MSNQKSDLMKEYAATARQELLWRVDQRDKWLKLQLISQVAIFAFANGLDLGFVKASTPLGPAIAFAFPVALVLAIFYFVEDRLIGLLSKYIGALAREAPAVDGKHLLAWDLSPQLSRYVTEGTLRMRALGQLVAFCVLPATLVSLHFAGRSERPSLAAVLVSGGALFGIVAVWLWSYDLRKQTGDADLHPVAVTKLPAYSKVERSRLTHRGAPEPCRTRSPHPCRRRHRSSR